MRHDRTLPTDSYIVPAGLEQGEMAWLKFTIEALVADRDALLRRFAAAPSVADWAAAQDLDEAIADYTGLYLDDHAATRFDRFDA